MLERVGEVIKTIFFSPSYTKVGYKSRNQSLYGFNLDVLDTLWLGIKNNIIDLQCCNYLLVFP